MIKSVAMRFRTGALAVTLALAPVLGGCSVYRDATASSPNPDWGWRQIVTDADRDRLRGWRKNWDEALAAAQGADGGAIATDPLLFDPDRALDKAMPPAGSYHCRTIKLGAVAKSVANFTAYPATPCTISEERSAKRFTIMEGAQRPTGLIWSDTDPRAMFLGTLELGDERGALRYGLDGRRDMIGYFERIGDARWRLVLPRPRFESMLDVIELVPAG